MAPTGDKMKLLSLTWRVSCTTVMSCSKRTKVEAAWLKSNFKETMDAM